MNRKTDKATMKNLLLIIATVFCCSAYSQLKITKQSKGYTDIEFSDAKQKILARNNDSGMFYLIDTKPAANISGFTLYIPLGVTTESAIQSLDDMMTILETLPEGDIMGIEGKIANDYQDSLDTTTLSISIGKILGMKYLAIQHPYNGKAVYAWDKKDLSKMRKALE